MAKVLIVEDEYDARDMLERHLSDRGFDVTGVADGEDAIEQIGVQWDAVITDLIMDNVDGIQVLAAYTEALHPAIKIVTTSFADKNNTLQALNSGADYLVEKPFTIDQLANLLNNLLSQNKKQLVHATDADEEVIGSLFDKRMASLPLSPGERRIAALAVKGLANKDIARVCGISEQSVKNRLLSVYRKLHVSSRAQLMHLIFPI